jgi:hypothetical protein
MMRTLVVEIGGLLVFCLIIAIPVWFQWQKLKADRRDRARRLKEFHDNMRVLEDELKKK